MATMEVKFSPKDLKAAQSAERIPEPCIVVIFGASGDLTKRKLLPALFHLQQQPFCRRTSSSSVSRAVTFRRLCDRYAGRHSEGRRRDGGDSALKSSWIT